MNEEVMKKAQELNLALRNCDEYKAYVEANNKVKEHSAADIMVRDFRKKQLEVQKKHMEGQSVEADVKELQKLWEVISINPYVSSVITAELVFGQLYGEVMQAVGKDIELLESAKKMEEESNK